MATGGNLVFQGNAKGEFVAYAAGSGDELWSVQTGSAINATPASYSANNTQYVNAFPFLNTVQKLTNARRGGCGKCGTASKQRAQVLQSAKHAIVALSEDKKRELKRLLNTEKIQIKYRSGQKIVTHQF